MNEPTRFERIHGKRARAVLGIDPGITGAYALLVPGARSSCWAEVWDMPTLTGTRRRLDEKQALAWIRDNCGSIQYAVIEHQQAMPRQGSVSTGALLYQFGWWMGVLETLEIPFEVVRPQAWKKELLAGTTRDKAAARVVAARMFPGLDLGRRKDQGRADAILLAEFARRRVVG